jgi:hypothetical protein
LAYVYKLDPASYFGEEEISSRKNEIKKENKKQKRKRKTSSSEKYSRAPLNGTKKDVSNGENLPEVPEDGDFILPPQELRPPISSVLAEDTRLVNISLTEIPCITYIAASLPPEQEDLLIEVICENVGHFAWSYQDIPGLDPKLVVHHLAVDLGAKPVKQKLRKMHPKVALLVKEELEKLLEAKIIHPIDYSEWISNMVHVTKPSGDIRICTDFKDLNKAFPKDDFPLPNINMIVDLTTSHELLSLMDGFSRYNQIHIVEEDQHKMAFTMPWGTFCYNMMPFRLKNVEATYQGAMKVIFHDLIHKILEDYVDDILVKNLNALDHLSHLEHVFNQLAEYHLMLNPKKCVFGVTSGKLLGFIVSWLGIEIDPKKVKAIMNMAPPRTLKNLHSLQGKLQSVQWFISPFVDKYQPFTHLLKKDQNFKWDPAYQRNFELIKKYLANPPILVPLVVGHPLILYIIATPTALGALLQYLNDEGKERAIYYISRTLVGYELNYRPIEKACLAMVFSTQKLHHYMLSHTVHLISKIDPLKYMLSRTTLTGCLAKWVMLLSEFDIQYVDRMAVKGQAIANHLADAPLVADHPLIMEFPEKHLCLIEEQTLWKLYFDGSYTTHGSSVGILLVTPQGDYILKYFKLQFWCTNNIAEYEALVAGLKITIKWNIMELQVYGDSQLIINQALDEYQTKDDKLLPYKDLVDQLREHFTQI